MSYRGSFLASVFAFLFLALIAFAVVGYAMGWLTIGRSPERTTIEINTQSLEDAAGEAKKEGAEFIERTGEQLRESGEALEDAVDSPPAEENDRQ